MTTYTDFAAGLAALNVTGVQRTYAYPPLALSTADLPAMWVQLPRGQSGALTLQANSGWPTLRGDLVIAVEPVAQERQQANMTGVLALMDALCAALDAAAITKGPLSWTIRQAVVEVAGTAYWAVVAEVEGKG